MDLTKKFKNYYTAGAKPEIVAFENAVPYLAIRGKGDPSGVEFSEKIQAMYSTAYAVKFHYKTEGKDFVVAKLEGQWWFDEARFGSPTIEEAPRKIPRSEWEFRLLLRMPDFVEKTVVEKSALKVAAEKGIALATEVHFFALAEGKAVQMLHIGSFSTEPASLVQLRAFCEANGLEKNGLHHEIYLSDFRKTAPEKLKTILREPVK